jgi:hypothetical protein
MICESKRERDCGTCMSHTKRKGMCVICFAEFKLKIVLFLENYKNYCANFEILKLKMPLRVFFIKTSSIDTKS